MNTTQNIEYTESREVLTSGGLALARYSVRRPLLPFLPRADSLYKRAEEKYIKFIKGTAFPQAQQELDRPTERQSAAMFKTRQYLLFIEVTALTEKHLSITLDSVRLVGTALTAYKRRAAIWSLTDGYPTREEETVKELIAPPFPSRRELERRFPHYDGMYIRDGSPILFKNLELPYDGQRMRDVSRRISEYKI